MVSAKPIESVIVFKITINCLKTIYSVDGHCNSRTVCQCVLVSSNYYCFNNDYLFSLCI